MKLVWGPFGCIRLGDHNFIKDGDYKETSTDI